MRLPKGIVQWELRRKGGGLIYQLLVPEWQNWEWHPRGRIIGPVAWYRRVRGERFKRVTDWFDYWA